MGYGFSEPGLEQVSGAEIVFTLDVIRVEANRLSVASQSLFCLAGFIEGISEIVPGDVIAPRYVNGVLEQADAIMPVTHLDASADQGSSTGSKSKASHERAAASEVGAKLRYTPSQN